VQAVASIPMQGWKTQKTGQPTTCSYLTGLTSPLYCPVQTIEELQQPNDNFFFISIKNKNKSMTELNLHIQIKNNNLDIGECHTHT
jgi:hypothetical protein